MNPLVVLAGLALATAAPPVGDRHVAYAPEAGVESAYRLFVPEDWTPGQHWPLVVILHGGSGTENTPFDRTPGFRETLLAAARAHHFILLSPRGGKGWYGARMLADGSGPTPRGTYRWPPAGRITAPPPALPPLTDDDLARSERDVIASIAEVARTYGTDARRTYLMGNSMGSVGTLHLAQAHPQRWCAIAPSDGPVDPVTFPYARVARLDAALFVHGDDDRTAPIESMAAIAGGFDRAGVATTLTVIPGGTHASSWQRALPAIFDFFDRHACAAGQQGKGRR